MQDTNTFSLPASERPLLGKVGALLKDSATFTTGVLKLALVGTLLVDGLTGMALKAFEYTKKDPTLWAFVKQEQQWMQEQKIAPIVHLSSTDGFSSYDGSAFFQANDRPHFWNMQLQGVSGLIYSYAQKILEPRNTAHYLPPKVNASIVFGSNMQNAEPQKVAYTLRHEHSHLFQAYQGAPFVPPVQLEHAIAPATLQILSDYINVSLLTTCKSTVCEQNIAHSLFRKPQSLDALQDSLDSPKTTPLLLGYYQEALADARSILLAPKSPHYQKLQMNLLALEVYQYRTTGSFQKENTSKKFYSSALFSSNDEHNIPMSAFLCAQISDQQVSNMSVPQIDALAQQIAAWSATVTMLREAVHNEYFYNNRAKEDWIRSLAPLGYDQDEIKEAFDAFATFTEEHRYYAPQALQRVTLPALSEYSFLGIEHTLSGWAYHGMGGQMHLELFPEKQSKTESHKLYVNKMVSHFFEATSRFSAALTEGTVSYALLEEMEQKEALQKWLDNEKILNINAGTMQYIWIHYRFALKEQQTLIHTVQTMFTEQRLDTTHNAAFSLKITHPFFESYNTTATASKIKLTP